MARGGIICLAAALACAAAAAPNDNGIPAEARPEISKAVAAAAAKPHPRLFADAEGFADLKARLGKDKMLTIGAERLLAAAESIVPQPPLERVLQGRRLLHVSRAALFRINTLALAYRLYGKREHLDRAVAEMRAVCAFPDWNPSHFLDTAEMSLAVATGYDWLHGELDANTRREIADSLRRLGIDASRKGTWWVRTRNNWGQVCHAGILAATLALAEEDTADAARFVQRCVDCLPMPMSPLAPKGNYPEGPGYWVYGVEFNVIALALLEDTLGSDFGLASLPGFRETADYLDLVTGPSGLTFNYSDGGDGRGTSCATWWFAKRFGRPDLLSYFELGAYRRYCGERPDVRFRNPRMNRNRMFAYSLLWVRDLPPGISPKAPLVWDSKGEVPIAIQRSSWDDGKSLFVGLKGGSPSWNHGHMDGGSFVLESEGVRWAVDLGAEGYHGIESRGMNLWSMAQDSDRWRIYRLGTSSHNVPMIDGCQQLAKGFAKMLKVERDGAASAATLDLSSLYTNATSVLRVGTMAADGRRYTLRDTFAGVRAGATIRWAMMTRAVVGVDGDRAVLSQDGKRITLEQRGAQKGAWSVSEAKGPNEWDSPNPGCRQLTFSVAVPPDGKADIAVSFSF